MAKLTPTPPYIQKKKSHGLRIFLIILACVILLPIIFVFIFFFDPTHVEIKRREGITTNEIFTEAVSNSFDYVNESETSHKIKLAFTENQLDEIFSLVNEKMDPGAKQFVSCFYIDIDSANKNYDFIIEAQLAFFKTRMHLYTTLVNEPANEQFKFSINQMVLGRLPVELIAKNIIRNFVKPEQIQDIFKKAGLTVAVNLQDYTIAYKYKDMAQDIAKMVGESEPIKLFAGLFNDMVKTDAFELDAYSNERISWNFDLTKFHSNETYCDDDYLMDLKLDDNRTKIVSMANDEVIAPNDSDKVMNYLVRGYDYVSPDIKSYISGLGDLTKYGIPDVQAYKPLVNIHPKEEEAIEKIVPKRIKETIDNNPRIFDDGGELVRLYETDLNTILKGTSPIGKTFIFPTKYKEGGVTKNKISYATVESVYGNIVNNNLAITIALSINGYPVSFIIPTTRTSTKLDFGVELKYELPDFLLGNTPLSNEVAKVVDDYFKEAAGSCGSWLKIDAENHKIKIDLSSLVSDEIKNILAQKGDTLAVNLKGNAAKDLGYVEVMVITPTP